MVIRFQEASFRTSSLLGSDNRTPWRKFTVPQPSQRFKESNQNHSPNFEDHRFPYKYEFGSSRIFEDHQQKQISFPKLDSAFRNIRWNLRVPTNARHPRKQGLIEGLLTTLVPSLGHDMSAFFSGMHGSMKNGW